MKNKFDISDFVDVATEQKVATAMVERVKKMRKVAKLSQSELSKKSGVSYGSIRRFEETGDISLASLLKLATALECLNDFDLLFKGKPVTNIKDFKDEE